MTQKDTEVQQALALPSALGIATSLFHFLYCMLISDLLLKNPLIGGGLLLVMQAAVLYGRWLHPLRFHTLSKNQKLVSIILLSVTFLVAMALLSVSPVSLGAPSLWLILLIVFYIGMRPVVLKHLMTGWVNKPVSPVRSLMYLLLSEALALIPPCLLFFTAVSPLESWWVLFGFVIGTVMEGLEIWLTRHQDQSAPTLNSEEMAQLDQVHAYKTFTRTALLISAAMQATLLMTYTFIGVTADEMFYCIGLALLCTGLSFLLTGVVFRMLPGRDPTNVLYFGLVLWIVGLLLFSSNILKTSMVNAYLSLALCTLGLGVSVRVLTGMESNIFKVISFSIGHEPTQSFYATLRFQVEFASLCGQLLALVGLALICVFNKNSFPGTLPALAAGFRPLMVVPCLLLVFAALLCALMFPMTKLHWQKLDRYMGGDDTPALKTQLENVIIRKSLRHYGVRIVMAVMRPFYYHRIRGREIVPVDDAVNVFVCNHGEIYGPVVTNLYIPFSFRPWVISEMMDKEAIAKRTAEGAFTRFRLIPPNARWWLARRVAPFLTWAMRSVEAIPVYFNDPVKLRRTFRESVSAMEAGDNILLFPENSDDTPDHRYVLNGVSHFYTGFAMLGPMYFNKTGKRCHFVPIYANKQKRVLTFGRYTDFDPDNDPAAERDRICETLRNEMLRIAQEG